MEEYTYEWTEQDQREYEAAELASYKQQIAAQDKFAKVLPKLSHKLRQHIEGIRKKACTLMHNTVMITACSIRKRVCI